MIVVLIIGTQLTYELNWFRVWSVRWNLIPVLAVRLHLLSPMTSEFKSRLLASKHNELLQLSVTVVLRAMQPYCNGPLFLALAITIKTGILRPNNLLTG